MGGGKSQNTQNFTNLEKIFYKLYVIHNNIPSDYEQLLKDSIKQFDDFSSIDFINANDRFKTQWHKIQSKCHFAKEMLYKILLTSYFSTYDKIIVSDVDVVFLGDISESFLKFNTNDDIYISGVKMNNPDYLFPLVGWKEGYKKFNQLELEAIQYGIGGGYFIANLKKWRNDNIESKMIDFLDKNADRMVLAEQDILNIICYPKIGKLSPAHIIGNAMWDIYGNNWEKYKPNVYSKDEIDNARKNPIQIHYIGQEKPWNTPDVAMSDIWYKYLVKSPFLNYYLQNIESVLIKKYIQTTISYRIKKYIKNNPLFLLDYNFYVKLIKKALNGYINKWKSIS